MKNKIYEAGTVLGPHIDLKQCHGKFMTDHTHIQVYKNGKLINPTNLVYDDEVLNTPRFKEFFT